jgi:hypothetical protein
MLFKDYSYKRTSLIWLLAILIPLILIVSGCGASSQEFLKVPPVYEVDAMTAYITEELSLTDEQRFLVHDIVNENAQIRSRIEEKFRMRPMALQASHNDRLDRFDFKIHEILTVEQQELYKRVRRLIRRKDAKLTKEVEEERFLRGDPNYNRGYGY